jgi:mevalonate kinase
MKQVGVGTGKVILLGEHAVVHGHAALAASIDLAVVCDARPAAALRLRVPAWGIDVGVDDDHPVAVALRAICDRIDPSGPRPALELVADARVPAAAGLGSSAAMAVAIAQILSLRLGRDTSDDAICALADAAERCFHANPSGVDVALAARGGIGLFRRGAGLAPLDAPPVPLAIAVSGVARSTAAMVERVTAAAAADPARAADLAAMGAAAEAAAPLVVRGDWPALGPLFDDAHARLGALGVSTPLLDELVAIARGAGALGAKLTGAGGGGAVIALAPGREDAVLAAWRARGVSCFTCRAGARWP